jgi:hypothetical protein
MSAAALASIAEQGPKREAHAGMGARAVGSDWAALLAEDMDLADVGHRTAPPGRQGGPFRLDRNVSSRGKRRFGGNSTSEREPRPFQYSIGAVVSRAIRARALFA